MAHMGNKDNTSIAGNKMTKYDTIIGKIDLRLDIELPKNLNNKNLYLLRIIFYVLMNSAIKIHRGIDRV